MEGSTAMTRIDEIRDRLDKATPGVVRIDGSHKAHENPKSAYAWEFQGKLADAVLLVHAHDDIRWLLDTLARRDARCADLAVQLDAVRKLHRQIPIYDTPIDECSEHDPDEHGIELDDGEIYCDQHVAYFACDECSSCTEDVLTEYPCPTIQALTKEN